MTDTPDLELVSLTASITEAFVSNNQLAVSEVGQLIAQVHETLVKLGEPAAPDEPRATPAVSIRASIKNDHLICLECGRKMTMITRHLNTDHQMSVADYRAKFALPRDYPTVAPAYAARRTELAKQSGLGRKRVAPAVAATKPVAKSAKASSKSAASVTGNDQVAAPAVRTPAKPPRVKASAPKSPAAKPVKAEVPAADPAPAKQSRKAPAKD